MSTRYGAALALAEQLAREAGALLRAEFHRPGGPEGRRGFAAVDLRAERLIRHGLRSAYPTWGYRGEETRPHEPAQDAEGHVWLVDPNDGTAAFVRGQRGSAVSIGLLRAGVPVLGVVYAPCAPDSAGDLVAWAEGCGPLRRNGEPVAPPSWPADLTVNATVLVSDGAERRPLDNLRILAPARFRALPSIAYRLALAAAGEGAAAASLHTPGDWDYGAGHALLGGAGLDFVDEAGQRVLYTRAGESRVRRCFGGAHQIVAELARRDWSPVLQGRPAPWPAPDLPFDFVRLQPGATVADPALLARAHGALLGLLVADAWAAHGPTAPLDAWPPAPFDRLGGLAGQPTPWGESALLLARALDQAGGVDPALIAAAARWHQASGPAAPGPGATPAQRAALHAVAELLVLARDPASASPASSLAVTGLEALVWVTPLALLGRTWPSATLAEIARQLCAWYPPAAEACAAYTLLLVRLVATGESLAAALGWLAQNVPAAAAMLTGVARAAPVDAVLARTIAAVARAPSFAAGVAALLPQVLGGESPLPGASAPLVAGLAGALLGALHGRDGIPLIWRQLVLSCRPTEGLAHVPRPRPRPCWPVDALALAERLLVAGR